jgi:hypothetical protein
MAINITQQDIPPLVKSYSDVKTIVSDINRAFIQTWNKIRNLKTTVEDGGVGTGASNFRDLEDINLTDQKIPYYEEDDATLKDSGISVGGTNNDELTVGSLTAGGIVKANTSGTLQIASTSDIVASNGILVYDRTFTDPAKNTIALGSLNTSTYKGCTVLLTVECSTSGYEFSGQTRYSGFGNNTAGIWKLIHWDKYADKNTPTAPAFYYEVMSDSTNTNFRVRVMR